MKDSRLLSIPEVVGKTIVEACLYGVEPEGREILLRFSDATQLSIEVDTALEVDILYCEEDIPDEPLLHVKLPRGYTTKTSVSG